MKIIHAKDFKTRDEIEMYVVSVFGKTIDAKDVKIKGTKSDLNKLGLKNGTVLWGVICIQTGKKDVVPCKNIANRGEIHKSKINGQVINTNKK